MADQRFPILGDAIPPMLGRIKIMERIWSDLTKVTPSHLSVVGPRHAGKSVLLTCLAERMRGKGSPYCSVILWDLGHQTPRTDEEFLKLLCRRLGEGIKGANEDYGKHLLSVDQGEYAEICEVIDAMGADSEKILMLWDGFDKPLSSGALTRNLWDNLLDLCRRPSFRLVTATRKELHELIRDEKSVTSDFWGVFDSIVRVTIFDEADIEEILSTLPSLKLQPGAKKELVNWSSGFPPLFLGILNQIMAEIPSGQIDNLAVNQAGRNAMEKLARIISSMWNDCHTQAKDLYVHLVVHGDKPLVGIGKDEQRCLIEKGFAKEVGNKLSASCRMLQEYIQGASPDAGSMARLFGTWEDYKANIRSLLERRLAQINRFDDRLYRLVARAIEDIPESPDDCLNNLTSIEERALDLIWQREFNGAKKVPQEIIDYWSQVIPRDWIGDREILRERSVQRLKEQAGSITALDRGAQCGILQILTGSRIGFDSKAKFISKDSYVLINALHTFRNRGEHADGQSMYVGVAVAAIMACIELLSCLDRELTS